LVVKLYTPHSNQLKIHNSINNEPYKYYVLNIGRQFGKSLLGLNQALHWFFNIPNCKIGWVSPVYKQCKKVFKDIDNAFANNQNVFKDKNKTDLYLIGHNNASINFYSAESYDSARGETFDFLIMDEFAFQPEEAWTEVFRATVLVRGQKVIFLSTPKGKNHFHKLHALSGVNDNYKSFTMTSYDNPIIIPSEIDDAKLTLPEHVFRQEYLAEFIDGGSGIFKDPNIIDKPNRTNRCYAGVDIGRMDDYTVITVYNELGQMIYIERWRMDNWANISRAVAEVINTFDCMTLIEVNGLGDAVYEQIQNNVRNKNNVNPFVTTSKSKQNIIEQISVANQNKEVSFLPHDWLIKELDIFTFVYNPQTRNIKYSAPNGFHDDGVMSSAIGYEAFKTLKMSGKIILDVM
jgi:hypothetical protein